MMNRPVGNAVSPPPVAVTSSAPWWKQLNRYHWFVFLVASLAWLFDCLDQQLFILARPAAMKALLPAGTDPSKLKEYGGLATAIFVAGWAMGGLIFGAVGDRIGRARTLTFTVLMYSVCTGLSAFSQGFTDFAIYRFVTGLGVGGVFGLSVALVADSLPDAARPHALGLLQSLSAIGNITAGLIGVSLGYLEVHTIEPGSAWSKLFLVGSLPAFLCVFIQMRLKEPEKWVKARAAGKLTGVRFGSYAALLGDPRWRSRALVGMTLCVSGVIGLWGIGFFSPELINDVIGRALQQEGIPAAQQPGYRTMWTGLNMIIQNIGAFAGMMIFTKLASRFGRKPIFALGYVCAMISTIGVFKFLNQRSDIFWMIPIMGFFQLSIFAGFAIYLPELFPVSLRSTGTSFCYNVGRFIAAGGPLLQGKMTMWFAAGAVTPEQKLEAFRNACGWMSAIFLLGLIALPFAPETRGRPLPEDDEGLAS
jgi:MFS family permease